MSRKVVSVLLCVCLIFALSVPAAAASPSPSASPSASPSPSFNGGHSSGGGAGRFDWWEANVTSPSDALQAIFDSDDPQAAYDDSLGDAITTKVSDSGFWFVAPATSVKIIINNRLISSSLGATSVVSLLTDDTSYQAFNLYCSQGVSAPVSGSYTFSPIFISSSGVLYLSSTQFGFKLSQGQTKSLLSGDLLTSTTENCWLMIYHSQGGIYATVSCQICWFVVPADFTMDNTPSGLLPSSPCIGTVSGDVYVANDDGTTTIIPGVQFVDEENKKYFILATNTWNDYTSYTYDYSTFTYNFVTDSGNTSITYGDEYISCSETVNNITNVYNYYYHTGSSSDDSGDSSVPSSGWDWLKNLFGDGFSGLLSDLGSALKSIVEFIIDLVKRILSALAGVLSKILDGVVSIFTWLGTVLASIFASFTEGFASFFAFLWTDAYSDFNAA